MIDWAALRFDAPLAVTAGVLPVAQADDTLRAFERAIGAYDTPRLAALHLAKVGANLTKLTPQQAEYIGVGVSGLTAVRQLTFDEL